MDDLASVISGNSLCGLLSECLLVFCYVVNKRWFVELICTDSLPLKLCSNYAMNASVIRGFEALDICGEKVAMVSLNDSWLTAGDKKSIWLGRISRMPASGSVSCCIYNRKKWEPHHVRLYVMRHQHQQHDSRCWWRVEDCDVLASSVPLKHINSPL